jgi:hypothetical protein
MEETMIGQLLHRHFELKKFLRRLIHWLTWLTIPGPSYQVGALKLAALSLVSTVFFLFVGELTFPGGAFQFTDYAKALIEGTAGPHLSARDIGYPLLLLATGYQFHHSFIGVILVQAAMAWAMPLLVYGAVGPFFRAAAYLAGLATIVSMSPYLFMKMIHHDQLYIFLSLLTIYLAIAYLRNSKIPYLYFAISALIAASLTRPAGNLLALPLLLLLWFFRPVAWKHYLACGLIVSLCMFTYAEHRTRLLGVTMEGSVPSYKGRQIFYNLYVNSPDFGVKVDESLGPATARLYAKARNELKKGSLEGERMNIWYRAHNFPDTAKYFWFTQFNGKNEAFIDSLINHPSHDYFEFFCWVETTDQVFLHSAIEIVRKYPLYPIQIMLKNAALFFWTPGYAHGRFGLSFDSFGREGLNFLPLNGDIATAQIEAYIPDPGKMELLSRDKALILELRAKTEYLEKIWKKNYEIFNQIAFILAVIALVGMIVSRNHSRPAIAVTWLFLLYNVLVTSAFAEPNYRYHFFVIPMLLVLAGLGAGFVFTATTELHRRLPQLRRVWPFIDTKPELSDQELSPDFKRNQCFFYAAIALIALSVAIGWAYLLRLQSVIDVL